MRVRRFKFGLRWKLNLLIGAVVVITMSLFEGLSLYRERQMLINARAQHLEELVHHLAWVLRADREQDQQNIIFNYERHFRRMEVSSVNGLGQEGALL